MLHCIEEVRVAGLAINLGFNLSEAHHYHLFRPPYHSPAELPRLRPCGSGLRHLQLPCFGAMWKFQPSRSSDLVLQTCTEAICDRSTFRFLRLVGSGGNSSLGLGCRGSRIGCCWSHLSRWRRVYLQSHPNAAMSVVAYRNVREERASISTTFRATLNRTVSTVVFREKSEAKKSILNA